MKYLNCEFKQNQKMAKMRQKKKLNEICFESIEENCLSMQRFRTAKQFSCHVFMSSKTLNILFY